MPRKRVLLAIVILIFAIIVNAKDKGEYFLDRLNVRIDRSAGNIQPMQTLEGWRFGRPDLDLICTQFGINKIEKLIPWSKPPLDPEAIDMSRVFTVYFPVEADLFAVIKAFSSAEKVVYAEPYFIREMFYTPNDPYLSNQWGLDNAHTQAELAFDYCQGDPAVKIAIVDSGIDMEHPDLMPNFWVNPGEDLNGNGIVERVEQNNVDDDGNGFIDDFWGWDFINNDNYPNDDVPPIQGGGHGTHCAGIASAQTDNGIGVASLGFDCSLVTVRTGAGQYIYYGFQGIEYAIIVAADVISLSWGGGGYSQAEQDIINQAHNAGIVVVAAAGNENTSNPMYPAAYDNVYAVASTNVTDIRSSYSNYGTWVDISAPGNGIFSTYLNGTYGYMSGTSMACPFTAGLAGLVKSAFPFISNDEICNLISLSADDIYGVNPSYVGLLGAGRINAYQAMLVFSSPNLSMNGYTLTDDGNNDGRADPGENAEMVIPVSNQLYWQTATSVMAHLNCTEAGIIINDGEASYPDIVGGDTVDNEGDPFDFYVAPDFVPQYVTFYFELECQPNNYTLSDSISMLIGRPAMLLVDDDGGAAYEQYYSSALEEIDASYEYWDNNQSYITYSYLSSYETVIWFTGNEQTNSLDPFEQYFLEQYLDNGGKLFLSGQYIGDEISTSSFYTNYLHSSFVSPQISIGILTGIAGNPISAGTSLLLVGTGGAGNGLLSPSVITPVEPAQPLFYYATGPNIGGLMYENPDNNSKLVYLEFAFEAISGMGTPPTTSRADLMQSILNWFGSTTEVQPMNISISSDFELYSNYPNPFNSSTEITFNLLVEMNADVIIYDALGREVAHIASGKQTAGKHRVYFEGEGLSSGIYFCNLITPAGSKRMKMLLLK